MIETSQTLADVALRYPSASRVFRHHRLDFCCGGRRSVADACAERGLDPQSIAREIETNEPSTTDTDWQSQPLAAVIEHILVNFHEAHRRELPDLIALARKVERVHADKPNVPAGIAAHLQAMQQAMELHMQKEERILFPAIVQGRGRHMFGPTRQMELEHEEHGEKLRQLRELAGDYMAPPEACTSWRALLLRCEKLEADIMAHVHLENHVLFPRALRGDE
jgi:regulator of cell morphogenesis and NO signaling